MHVVDVAPRAERPGRRAASSKPINYSGLLDSDDEDGQSSDGEMVFKENDAVKAPTHTVAKISDEDNSDLDDFQPEDSPVKKKKPAAAAVKRPRKKAMSSPDSDSEKKVKLFRH